MVSKKAGLLIFCVFVVGWVLTCASAFAVELTVWSFSNQPLPDAALRAFEKANPGVTVTQRFPSGDMRGEGFLVASAAGIPPDLIHLNEDYLPMYVSNHLVVPITREINMGLFGPIDRYFPGTVRAYEGENYFVPHRISVNLPLYNRDLFNESGLDPDAPPITWDGFLQAARRLTRKDGGTTTQYGIVTPSARPDSLNNWYLPALWQAGGEFLQGNKVTVNTDAGRAALRFYAEPVSEGYSRFGALTLFRTGKAAILLPGTSVNVRTYNLAFVDVGRALQNKNRVAQGSLAGWVVANGKNTELAKKLLAFTLNPDYVKEFLKFTGFLPVRRDIGVGYFDPDDQQWAQKFVEEVQYTRFDVLHPEMRALMPVVAEFLNKAIDGNLAVNSAMEEAERQANLYLTQAGYK